MLRVDTNPTLSANLRQALASLAATAGRPASDSPDMRRLATGEGAEARSAKVAHPLRQHTSLEVNDLRLRGGW
jgi:hypothetical protein